MSIAHKQGLNEAVTEFLIAVAAIHEVDIDGVESVHLTPGKVQVTLASNFTYDREFDTSDEDVL